MSSPVQQPLPRYPRRSLGGPVVLIIIGVLFLLANLRLLPWRNLGLLFARYWPLLLIIWGVIKLVEYYQAQRQGYRPRGLGVGGVFLLIFVVLAGFAFTGAARYGDVLAREVEVDGQFFSLFGQTYTYNAEFEQPFTEGMAVQVSSDRGDITVNTWDEKKIKIVAHKRVLADSEDEARKINEQSQPQFTVGEKLLTINANSSGQRRVATDVEIYMPANASVDLNTRRGDLLVRNRVGPVKAGTSHGDVTVEQVKGDVNVSLRGGSFRADEVSGDVILDGRVNDSNINGVGGALRLNGDFFGTMKLSRVAKGIQFTSSRTDLRFGKLDGDLTLESGELRANTLTGPFSIVTRSKDIHLDDVSGDVKVENTNGEVEIHAVKLPLGRIEIDNRKGDIQITVPAKAVFQIDARTRRGEIESDFPELTITNEHGEANAKGQVGSGGPQLQISNEYGSIAIRKAG